MKIDFDTQFVAPRLLERNSGQIPGVPANPRKIDRGKLDRLAKSLRDSRQMLELRPIIAYRHEGKLVVIAGNMRLAAASLAGFEEIRCHVIEKCDSAKTLREIAIKDNVAFGKDDFDALMSEWDREELEDWGMDIAEAEKPEDGKEGDGETEAVDIVISVPAEESDSVVTFLASNGYECAVKPRKKKT